MKKLLILGAGEHGQVVAEIARECGFNEICFLDDQCASAMGKLEDIERFANQFRYSFVGIGNNQLRERLTRRLVENGYEIPTLIHPTAYVAVSASIGMGTVVGPKVVINTNSTVLEGCILSAGATIDHNVEIQDYVHINAGAVIRANSIVEKYRKVDA